MPSFAPCLPTISAATPRSFLLVGVTSPVRRSQIVGRRLLEHFLGGSDAPLELLQSVTPQSEHALADREPLHLVGRRAVENQVANSRRHRHHFVHTLPAPVTGV